MSKGTVNKVILIGRLGADPDVRYMPNGDAIAKISMATNEQRKDSSGQMQETTEWHKVTFFGKTAEVCGQYLRKGSKIYIEGRIRTNKWQDQSGQDRYFTQIIADQMQMLDSKASSGGSEYESTPRSVAPPSPPPRRAAPPPPPPPMVEPEEREDFYNQPATNLTRNKPAPSASFNADEEFNDDIPF